MDEHQSNRVQVESQSEPTETFSSSSSTPARIPKSIGRYRIKRVLATGGMGTVYEALQEQPRRTVAVKVMKHGVASRSAMRRFEYESQLLARLRHPGIAQIYEAGTHDDGTGPVPFFAMEYIGNAKPITQYANDKKLDTRARLELFMRVCAAAHHGHQKGIIHRDLKPGNILVDSRGDVKIIDFGVARGTDSDLAVTTLQTDVGQLIGTLQYMSPEQCDADPNDIDTRSDVYSMGVVLYELLAGRPPYQVTRAKIYEGTRAIREEQPTSLSTVDSTLKGDIETIVLKALQKDRDRRYQSAAEMGADIQRYLNGEAIIARPPSMAYQLRIFARRNKPVAVAVAAVILALSAGLLAVSVAYVRIQNAQAETEREQQLRMQAEQFAEQSRIEMERHRANAVAMLPLKDRIGQPAPVFDAATLEGKPLGGESFKEYPATVLNFVAANCPYSTRKVTELCGIRKAYGDVGVRFVNIAQTMKRKVYNAADCITMFTGEGQDWELVYDPGGAIGDTFNIRGFPKLVVVDNNGKIVEAGTFKGSYLADSLDKILANNSNIDLKKIRKTAESPVNTDLAALEDIWRRRLEVHRRVTGVGAEAYYQLAKLLRAQGKYTEAEDMYRQAAKSYAEVIGTDHSLVRSSVAGLADLLDSQNRQLDTEALIKDLLAKNEGDDTKNPTDPAQP